MINLTGDLFSQQGWLCITTNGFVKNNGRAVMGRGCAQVIRDRVPGIDLALGAHIKKRGNIVGSIGSYGNNPVFSFPVKHNWWEEADMELIAKSATELREMWLSMFDGTMPDYPPNVYIPRPGCGNGRLSYKAVEPVLRDVLVEDAFKIITF